MGTLTDRETGPTKLSLQVGKIDGEMDMFCVTDKGAGALTLTQSFHSPVVLMKFRLHKSLRPNYNEFVFFEAMLELSHQGWAHQVPKGVKGLVPYKPRGLKVWYLGTQLSVHYLRGLLHAGQLFEKGLTEIYHCQLSAYYKTLLVFLKESPHRLQQVKPNQPLAFYKVLRAQNKKGHVPGRTDAWTTETDIEEEAGSPSNIHVFSHRGSEKPSRHQIITDKKLSQQRF